MKSLFDVADNLERAAGSVTDQSLKGLTSDGQKLTTSQTSKLLKGLLDGVTLTDRILIQAWAVLRMLVTTWHPASLVAVPLPCMPSAYQRSLWQALKQNGVEKFSPLGDKFDPNIHSALFQLPDPEKEAGTVVVVTKVC